MAEMFLKPFVQHRARISARLLEPTVKAKNYVLGVKPIQSDANTERKSKRYNQFLDEINRKGYKLAKNKLLKYKDIRQKCKSTVCPQHSIHICNGCKQYITYA